MSKRTDGPGDFCSAKLIKGGVAEPTLTERGNAVFIPAIGSLLAMERSFTGVDTSGMRRMTERE